MILIKILYGKSGSGKTADIISQIKKEIIDNPYGNPIILIVPEQMTFQAEWELLKDENISGYARVQVYSFSRLAYRLLQTHGQLVTKFLSDETINMLLNYIINTNKEKLKVFDKMANFPDFPNELNNIFDEMNKYLIDEGTLDGFLKKQNQEDDLLYGKLSDLSLIYTELLLLTQNQYLQKTDLLNILIENISDSPFVKNSTVYIDGYYSYTTQELQVVNTLAKNVKDMTITFTFEQIEGTKHINQLDLFNLPYRNYIKFKKFLQENKLKSTAVFYEDNLRHKQNAELAHICDNFDKETTYNKLVNNIEISKMETPRDEVELVAEKIYDLVSEQNVTYSEIAVLHASEELYVENVETIFSEYDIPFFIDQTKLAKSHHFTTFIKTVLSILGHGFNTDDILALIKTGLFFDEDDNDKITMFENYCLAAGMTNAEWYKDSFEKIDDVRSGFEFKEIEALKNKYIDKFKKLIKKINQAKEVATKVSSLYNLLNEFDIANKLNKYIEQSDDKQKQEAYKELWNNFIDQLDEITTCIGDKQISNKNFSAMLIQGAENLKYRMVPPVLDKVNVGLIKRSRFQMLGSIDSSHTLGAKYVFVIGMNEDILPKHIKESAILNENNRQRLLEEGIELSPTLKQSYHDDMFLAYTVFSLPSEKLYVSYFTNSVDDTSKNKQPSPIIRKLKKMFPKLVEKNQEDFYKLTNSNKGITNNNKTFTKLLKIFKVDNDQLINQPIINDLENYFDKNDAVRNFIQTNDFDNKVQNLESEVAEKLYINDDVFPMSVSRLEEYRKCPYSYFIEKGLGINKLKIQKLEMFDIGNVFHQSIEQIGLELLENNRDFRDLTEEELVSQATSKVDSIIQTKQYKYFRLHENVEYIKNQLKVQLAYILGHLKRHSEKTKFNLSELEFDFSKLIKLPTGETIQFKGAVDRVDKYSVDNEKYLYIVDYKLRNKSVSFESIYHGLSLQLPFYLEMLTTDSEFDKTGFYYFNIYNHSEIAQTETSKELATSLNDKGVKFNGYTITDENVVNKLDSSFSLEDATKCEYFDIKSTKKQSYDRHSKVLDNELLNAVCKYAYKNAIREATQIISGDIALKPTFVVDKSEQKKCRYCDYKKICKFDLSLGNSFNKLPKVNKEDALEKMSLKDNQ